MFPAATYFGDILQIVLVEVSLLLSLFSTNADTSLIGWYD